MRNLLALAQRVWTEISADRVFLIAAGATYYLLLALFPSLIVLVSLYGFFADPITLVDQLGFLDAILPDAGTELVQEELASLASQGSTTLSIAFLIGFLFALWAANSGIKTLFEAMNVAYGETEKRGFLKLNLITLGFTIAGLLVIILFILALGVLPLLLARTRLADETNTLITIAQWVGLVALILGGLVLLYRYGPSRAPPRWGSVIWGAVLAAAGWIVASIAFSWYLANFARYQVIYGSLGAVIGLMIWMWISMVIVILGAELNVAMEEARVERRTLMGGTDSKPPASELLAVRGASAAQAGAATASPRGSPPLTAAHGDADAQLSLPLAEAGAAPVGEGAVRDTKPEPRLASGVVPIASFVGYLVGLGLTARNARSGNPARR